MWVRGGEVYGMVECSRLLRRSEGMREGMPLATGGREVCWVLRQQLSSRCRSGRHPSLHVLIPPAAEPNPEPEDPEPCDVLGADQAPGVWSRTGKVVSGRGGPPAQSLSVCGLLRAQLSLALQPGAGVWPRNQ